MIAMSHYYRKDEVKMFIYTHENEIINMNKVQYFYITYEEEDNAFELIATFKMSYTTIGKYKTKEEAIKVLNSICNKIKQKDEIFVLDSTYDYSENK
jgi:hypothetical protein